MQTIVRPGVRAAGRHRGTEERSVPVEDANFRARALDRIAQERLARIAERRDVARLSAAGKSQREIADILRTTQPRVGRIVKVIERLGDPFEVTPEEIILRAHVDGSSRDELVKLLSSYNFSDAQYAPHPAEGKIPGTWDQVRQAYFSGFISEAEFDRIKFAVHAG